MLAFFLYVPQTVGIEINAPIAYLSIIVIVQAVSCRRVLANHCTCIVFVQFLIGIDIGCVTPVACRVEVFVHIVAYTHGVFLIELVV